MCRMEVEVVVVDDDRLDGVWAAGLGDGGRRVLWVRRSATPIEVAEGYGAALRECAIRKRLETFSLIA